MLEIGFSFQCADKTKIPKLYPKSKIHNPKSKKNPPSEEEGSTLL